MITKIRLRILETLVFGFITSVVGFVIGIVCGFGLCDTHHESSRNISRRKVVNYTGYYNKRRNEDET